MRRLLIRPGGVHNPRARHRDGGVVVEVGGERFSRPWAELGVRVQQEHIPRPELTDREVGRRAVAAVVLLRSNTNIREFPTHELGAAISRLVINDEHGTAGVSNDRC